jgi:hypothetical protein
MGRLHFSWTDYILLAGSETPYQRPVRKMFIPLTLSESFIGAAKTCNETLGEF